MKSFRALIQRIDQWRQLHPPASLLASFQTTLARVAHRILAQIQRYSYLLKQPVQLDQILALVLRPNIQRRKSAHQSRPSVLLLLAVLSLTSSIGYRLYNEPQLDVGTIAPQTLRAPVSARVIDTKTTEMNRKAARTAAVPVLTINQTVNQEIYQALQRLLDQGEEIRQQAGAFPFVENSTLSTATQQFLRQAEEWQWRAALVAAEGNGDAPPNPPPPAANAPSNSTNSSQQLAIIELQNYRRTHPVEDFSALKEVINRARQRYSAALASLTTASPDEPQNFYDASLLALTDGEWLKTRSTIRQALERILSQGISQGMPDVLLQAAIKTQLTPDTPPNAAPLATKIVASVVEPNLMEDAEQTKVRAEQAAQAVKAVVVEIRRGEVIVEEGQPITQADFVLLDHFNMSRRRTDWMGLLGFAALIGGSVGIFLLVERKFHPGLRQRDHFLVLLLTLSAPLVVALNIPALNLPTIGLLVGSFYGSALGGTVIVLLSIILPIGMDVARTNLIASAVGGLVGGIAAGRLRTREELALLGGVVGLVQGSVYLLLNLILSSAATPVWYVVLTMAAVQTLMGIAWSVVALGISPYLEHLFDLITPIRLAELSNPNRPMLKRLASEAPGTFQHTLFVASLAEAAARAIGCNVELVRAGTLYHDIGKMHDSLAFIENQMGGPNKHDAIDDPWLSADIIKKHVTEGLAMARKARLPKAIQAFIPEHQGTMQIAFFHHQAQQQAKADPTIIVNDSDFRYDGPIPQSKETGIVMLADSCEAALRSLKDTSEEEALAMVNRILRARWQDNQLVDSGLTRAEMTQIAEIFVQVWQQFNHRRIPYPKMANPANKP